MSSFKEHLWKPGVSGNPGGRPKKAKAERVMNILDESVTDDDWRAIIKTLVSGAIAGKYRSAELLMAYGLGRPTIRVERIESDPIAEVIEQVKQAYIDAQAAQQYTVIDVTATSITNTEE